MSSLKQLNALIDKAPTIPRQLIILGLVFGARNRVGTDTAILAIRAAFFIVHVLLAFVMVVLYFRIERAEGPEADEIVPREFNPKHVAAVKNAKDPDAARMISELPQGILDMKAKELDQTKFLELVRKLAMAATISTLIHLYFQVPMPMVIQCVLQPFTLFDSYLFKMYILERKAEDYPDLSIQKRYKEEAPGGQFGEMMEKWKNSMEGTTGTTPAPAAPPAIEESKEKSKPSAQMDPKKLAEIKAKIEIAKKEKESKGGKKTN